MCEQRVGDVEDERELLRRELVQAKEYYLDLVDALERKHGAAFLELGHKEEERRLSEEVAHKAHSAMLKARERFRKLIHALESALHISPKTARREGRRLSEGNDDEEDEKAMLVVLDRLGMIDAMQEEAVRQK